MSRYWSYLNSAEKIVTEYNGAVPFAASLKESFRLEKKFGSRDRKIISQLCYGYFRLGQSFAHLPLQEKLLLGYFLTTQHDTGMIAHLKPEWKEAVAFPLNQKLELLNAASAINNLFPFIELLSNEIDAATFSRSHLIQPLMFLRLRPGRASVVRQQLNQHGSWFHEVSQDCLALAIGSKIEDVIMLNRDAVVQDMNSQKALDVLKNLISETRFTTWDCCAGSGGKSILLKDHFPNAELIVSDIRESIIINLKKRFDHAGITGYRSFVTDLAADAFHHDKQYDLVICDAPCSGSGTWGRTPEQLETFTIQKAAHYAALQKKIVLNASKCVKQNGWFLYITCSVFRNENEEVADFISANTKMSLVEKKYFPGYASRADSLFMALFRL
ncbi:MAG: methyltransferase domain-containing protein [Flavisolibacter sp.]|jgi:16S rRNA (cytosine967-C5)-methyltransferase|nr:methyltransferase domain-containing protein [Flavisolibacter sp.]